MHFLRKNFTSFKILTIGILFFSPFSFAQENSANSVTGSAKIFGEFVLTSNYMDEAISNSNNSFAMQPTMGYLWQHAQIGIHGSNVQFPDNGESLDLQPYAWYDFVASPIVDFKISYAMNMYFKSSTRNGNLIRLDSNLWTHHAIVEQNSNWYGTGAVSYWLAYSKSWKIIWDIDYELEIGYLMVNTTGYNSYFGVQTGFGYKIGDFYAELLGSYNSAASQFAGTADPAIWAKITTRF